MSINFGLTVTGVKSYQRALGRVVNSITPGKMRTILRNAGQPIYRDAKFNARNLVNNAGTKSIKTRRASKSNKYQPGKDFANAIAFKTPKNRSNMRLTIGPLQEKLNKSKYKAGNIPMPHWKEIGTKGKKGMKGDFPVYRAYKKNQSKVLFAIKRGILSNLKGVVRTEAILYFKGVGI